MDTTVFAQQPNCSEIEAITQMMRAKSVEALLSAKRISGKTYRAQLVFAYRAFELHPGMKTEAQDLLDLIPRNKDQQNTVMTLGDSLCSGESDADMFSLARVRDGLAQQLSKAVALAPQFMRAYIQFSLDAVADPHSDYALHMKKTCERDHARFLSAVKSLASDEEGRFRKYVMNPDTCRVIAMPEAQE